MHRSLALTLLLVGCTAHAPDPEPAPAPPAELRPPYVDVATARCPLFHAPIAAPELHPWLHITAGQNFHPGHTPGGFDAYSGGDGFPWFDVHSLDQPVIAPSTARVAAATRSTLLVNSRAGELGTLDRRGGAPRWLGEKLYPVAADETTTGVTWAVARADTTWKLARISASLQVTELGVPTTIADVRLAVTADDRVAVAWLEHDGPALRIKLAIEPELAHPKVVDEVRLPSELAELSRLTSVDLAIASDGPDGVGVAWRPLKAPTVVKPPKPPSADGWDIPTDPYEAEIRWFAVARDGQRVGAPIRQPTLAERRLGGSGLGPFGLQINGMVAGRLGGRAVFVWSDGGWISGARVDHEGAVAMTRSSNEPRIVLRPGELLLLDSSPKVEAFELRCL